MDGTPDRQHDRGVGGCPLTHCVALLWPHPAGDLRATLLNMGMQEGAQYLIREYGLPLTEESYFSVMREVIAELYETVELEPRRAHDAGKAAGRGRTHVHLLQHLGRKERHRAYPAGHRAVFLLHRGSAGRAAQKPPGGVLFECMSRLGGADPAACAACEDAVYAAATAHKAGYYVIGIADRTSAADEPEMRRICSQFVPRWDMLDWTRVY